MRVADVPGATGTLDTNYRGKMEAAADALLREGSDLVYVHVEAPDECGHRGELMNKVSAIERIDAEILGPLLKRMNDSGEDYAVLVLPTILRPFVCARIRTHRCRLSSTAARRSFPPALRCTMRRAAAAAAYVSATGLS